MKKSIKHNPYWDALTDMARCGLDVEALKMHEFLIREAEETGRFIEMPERKGRRKSGYTKPYKTRKQAFRNIPPIAKIQIDITYYLIDGYLTTDIPDRD